MVWIFLAYLVIVACYSVGNVYLRKSTLENEPWMLGLAFVLYMVGAFAYYVFIQKYSLGVATVLIAASQLVIMALVDKFLFSTPMSEVQIAGLVLAIIAIALVSGAPTISK